jgi:hypothetical protein
MEPLLGRIETLEQHVQALTQQTASIARRLRWWRRLACSVMVLTVFSLPLSLGAGHDVSGGRNRTVQGEADWRAGGLFQDQ